MGPFYEVVSSFKFGTFRIDVNNGIARRSWARNEGAEFAIDREMTRSNKLKVTMPFKADESLLDSLF